MKVVAINTFQNLGGASVACNRIIKAVNEHTDINCKMLLQNINTEEVTPYQQAITDSFITKKLAFLRFVKERLQVRLSVSQKKLLYTFSPANTGVMLHNHNLIKEADIIHLHWINFGFVSLKSLRTLLSLNKPIVWTMHDMWAFSGGCHLVGDCTNFQQQCGNCYYLKKAGIHDWSHHIWQKKQQIFRDASITFTAPSQWLQTLAKTSSLLQPFPIEHITHPLDTTLFTSLNQDELRQKYGLPLDKYLILFGAANIEHEKKGFFHLKKALFKLFKLHPEKLQQIEVVLTGKASPEVYADLPCKVHHLGLVQQEQKLVEIFNLADTFVAPTLEEVLGYMVMEALACTTPVVAFKTGGVVEMLRHKKNGYLAEKGDIDDLYEGLLWVINHPDLKTLQQNARAQVITNHAEQKIAQQYQKLYQTVLNNFSQ